MKHDPSRRDFLAAGGAAASFILLSPPSLKAMTQGPTPFEKLIPPDKHLDPAWVESLTARGEPRVHRGAELKYIGMPVSGICSGHLYLGGDGKLWLWDIFNIYRFTSDAEYKDPVVPSSPLEQGFALRILGEGGEVRTLDKSGFPGVSFRGEYPIGIVDYADPSFPVAVRLEAFSPFIPLDTEDSCLPATLLKFTLRNTGALPLKVELGGWLENKAGIESEKVTDGIRRNQVVREGSLLLVEGGVELGAPGEPARTGPYSGFPDAGTLSLALFDARASDRASAHVTGEWHRTVFSATPVSAAEAAFGAWHPADRFVGGIVRPIDLAPGARAEATFALTWHFPHLHVRKVHKASGRYYANRFKSSRDVATHVAASRAHLEAKTRLWRDTWYDSSLPWWFLDRTFANASTLATSTSYRFSNGRFYGWEGVGNCTGTCTHVWSYEQTMGRLFPELETALLEGACFNPGVALHADGSMNFRDESAGIAVDGHAGTILRAYRRHLTSPSQAFLARNWAAIRLATRWLMEQDTDADGILDRNQGNTLDADWHGKIPWLSGLYLAALRAAEEMALAQGDRGFAAQCRARVEAGRRNMVSQLWNGRYFVQLPEPGREGVVGSYQGCEIDQVLGQGWAFQVGLGRILPETATREALRSLWRYNFAPDVGPFRAAHKDGRWFAMPGEAGLIMCTHPEGTERVFTEAPGAWTQVYFNECMNGFEHQAAGHMIWEGLVPEGLAVERAVHDRYDASKRNPWNEIECGNHYARSMASFGVFLAACGFEYHGPEGRLSFNPRIRPEDFRCAFVTAEGWGSFSQRIGPTSQEASLELRWGSLRLRSFAVGTRHPPSNAQARVNGRPISCTHRSDNGFSTFEFEGDMRLVAGDQLAILFS
jgi:non-lysosomal glucosylceramidase